jgi:hypothetical protein
MRVSSLPPVLPPALISDLLRSRAVLPMIAVAPATPEAPDASAGEVPAFLLAPGDGEMAAVPSDSAEGRHLSRLLGEVAQVARVEATRPRDATGYSWDLPTEPRGWILDRTLLWTFLAGMWGRPQPPGGMGPPRRVDSSELLSPGPDDLPWTVRLNPAPGAGAGGEISWLILEGRPGGRPREGGDPRPSQSVATAAQRIRDQLRAAGWAGATASVHPQDHAAIRGGSGMMRFDGDGFRVYWPVRSFQRVLDLLAAAAPPTAAAPSTVAAPSTPAAPSTAAGAESAAAVSSALQIRALLGLVEGELRGWGLLRLVQMHPRTETEKRSRPAVRTVVELIRAEGVPRRTLVDSVYRDGEAYRAAAVLFGWCSPLQQRDLRAAFGPRRWEQLMDHARRRPAPPPGGTSLPGSGASGDDQRYPWNAVALAAELLVRRLASRVEQPGRRPPAAAVEIIRRSYIDVRSQRLRTVLQNQIDRGILEQVLEDVFLSQLRRDLPRLAREVVVLAATGESPAVRDRIAAVFSRRGREIFREDVAAVERAIERGDFADWDRVLAARQHLWGLYRGSARSRSRISPA